MIPLARLHKDRELTPRYSVQKWGVNCALRSAFTLLLLWFAATRSYAQSDISGRQFTSPSDLSPLLTLRKEVQEVDVTLTVTDHRGRYVGNLTPLDFAIEDNGVQEEQITYFENQTRLPLRIAIVVDTSDSEACNLGLEKKTAIAFLEDILRPASDLALVIGFNQAVHLAQGPTSDRHLLAKGIRSLGDGGETAIYDAVSAASDELAKIEDTQPSRRAILLITDGEENSSHINLERAQEIAQKNESTIYVLSTGLEISDGEEHERAMKQLAEASGGFVFRANGDYNLRSAFAKVEKGLRNQYVIGFRPARTSPDGTFHRLLVLGPKKLLVHHRAGYFAR